MSPRMRRLQRALEKSGHTGVELRWEPMGPALEMCGHSGGYIFESDQTREGVNGLPSVIPLGLSLAEALSRVRLYAPR